MILPREQRRFRPVKDAATVSPVEQPGIARNLGNLLRPSAAYRWLLPQLAAITPQYIEMTLRGALAGNHVQAWELFDLMEDTWPRLKKNANELKHSVVSLNRVWNPWQEEDEQASDSAKEKARLVAAAMRGMSADPAGDENNLDGVIYDILDAWFKGVSVQETLWESRAAGKLGTILAPRATQWVHPVCYAWAQSGRLGLRADAAGQLTPGITGSTSYQPLPANVADFPADKFLVAVCKSKSGSPLGGALLRPLAWWWCASNFSADWMLNFAQLFGLPLRWANYDPNAPQATIDAICNMLQNMGSSAWAAFPTGTTIDIKEAAGNGQHSPQVDILDRADKQCDLLILGQTLTSEVGGSGKGGGSLALGKVHEGVKGEIVSAAADFVEDVLNGQLTRSLMRLNYGDETERPELVLESNKESDLQADATIISTLATAGAGKIIGLDWLGKKFDIPKPQNGEETLGGDDPATDASQRPGFQLPNPNDQLKRGAGNPADAQAAADDEAFGARALQRILAIEDDALFARALAGLAGALVTGDGKFHGNQWVTVEDEKWTGTTRRLREKASDAYKKLQPVHHDELRGKVTFSGAGGSKTLSGTLTPHKAQSVKALPEIVQKGRVTASRPDRKGDPSVVAIHKLETNLKVGETPYRVETTIKQTRQGELTPMHFYLHRLHPMS